MKAKSGIFLFLCCVLLLMACEEEYSPRPRGYYRIDLPEKSYRTYDSLCPFTFVYPVYGVVDDRKRPAGELCWLNMEFPDLNATLHFSYKEVNGDLRRFLEDSRSLAMKHTQRADDIREIPIIKDSADVYGLLYDIRGNAASSLQFYVTDSSRHFLRGSLYFNAAPNIDSIAPVLEFLRTDVEKLIDSFEWKE